MGSKAQQSTEQYECRSVPADYETLTAERDALRERKRIAAATGNSAEYIRNLGRIAEIETQLQLIRQG